MDAAYERQREAFEMNNIPTKEIYVYHKGNILPEEKVDVIHNNLKVENTSGYTFGRGIYLSEYPDLRLGLSDSGLLLCKVMPGNEYLDKSYRLIPNDYNSKRVPSSKGMEEILIIENSSQILPCFFIHLSQNASLSSLPAHLPYTYKVVGATDNLIRPLEDQDKIPSTSTVYADSVPTSTTPQIRNNDSSSSSEEEGFCGSSSNVPNTGRARSTPVSQILNNGKLA